MVEGALERGHADVVAGEAGHRLVRKAVVLDGPIGPALPLEGLVVEVLVEVEQRDDAVAAERVDRVGDARQVGVVVDAGRGLDGLVDDADADRVVALGGEEGRVVVVKADAGRGVGRALVDHVVAVEDHHPSLGVGEEPAGVAKREAGRGRGRRRRGGEHGGGHGADERSAGHRCERRAR